MEHLIIFAIAALVAVVVLALFGKSIRIFGLRISWRDGMTVNFKRDEDREREKKQRFPLNELQEPWDIASALPEQKEPPPNNLTGKQFMGDDYTSALISSLEKNVQKGDYLDFDDGTSQEVEER